MDGIILILGEMNFNTIKFQILCCDTSLLGDNIYVEGTRKIR